MPLKGDRKRFSIRLNKGSQATMEYLKLPVVHSSLAFSAGKPF